jgi:hypothetical protein
MTAALVAAAAAVLPHAAEAKSEFSYSLSAGLSYSDNVERQGDTEESETTAEAGLQMSLFNDDGRMHSDVGADLQFRHYTDDTSDDELVGGLDGLVTFWFAPERFGWVLQNSYGQSLIDARDVDVAGNRQSVNYFSTGPDIVFQLGDLTQLHLQGRWSDVYYEESIEDNTRITSNLALVRQLTDTSSVSLNGEHSRIEFDQSPPNSDYDLHSVYLGYDARGARTTLQLQAGYSALHDYGDSSDGPLLSLAITRKVGARSTLTLDAGTGQTDTAEAFRRDYSIGGFESGTSDAVVSQDPFQSDYASLGWQIEGARTGLSITADWRREDHETDPTLDRDGVGAGMAVTRQVGPRTSARLSGSWNRQDFDTSGTDFDEWSAGLGVSWQFARGVSLTLDAFHFRGTGDTSAGAGQRDYDENRYTLRIGYSPGR